MSAHEEESRSDVIPFAANPDDDSRPELVLHPTFDECDDETLLELNDEYWDALIPDDDYEPLPERGDFWIDGDAA